MLALGPIRALTADAFNLTELAPGLYLHAGQPLSLDEPGHDDIANLGVVVGRRCVAVIDTGGSVRIGRALHAALRARTNLPVCYVINTHVHVDHVLGNAAFREDAAKFVGHAALASAIARSRAFFVKQYAADLDPPASEDQIIAPDQAVTSDLRLDLGERVLELHAWPRAHTDCDLTVYDQRTSTLFTGDLVFVGRLPALDGSVKGWLAVLDEMSRQKAAWVVPGHGPPTRSLSEALRPERGYLEALLAGVRSELSRGKSMQDAIEQVGYPAKSEWLLFDQVHPRNVARAYQELEWE
jgi:quinoprotein relay system zinc metallohydrolase 2